MTWNMAAYNQLMKITQDPTTLAVVVLVMLTIIFLTIMFKFLNKYKKEKN